MYQLPCQACSAAQSVSLAKAGDEIACDQCGAVIAVPKLGDLKQLPPAEESAEVRKRREEAEAGRSPLLFVSLGLVAVAALVIAGFCGLRWALIDVPVTTESHIAEYEEKYPEVPPAVLIREYENMEKYGLELAGPLGYIKTANQKREWGLNALTAAGVGAVALLAAFVVASKRRRGGV